jgi:hypothetical protein
VFQTGIALLHNEIHLPHDFNDTCDDVLAPVLLQLDFSGSGKNRFGRLLESSGIVSRLIKFLFGDKPRHACKFLLDGLQLSGYPPHNHRIRPESSDAITNGSDRHLGACLCLLPTAETVGNRGVVSLKATLRFGCFPARLLKGFFLKMRPCLMKVIGDFEQTSPIKFLGTSAIGRHKLLLDADEHCFLSRQVFAKLRRFCFGC